MRFITQSSRRKLYAEQISDGEFVLSAFPEVAATRRPVARFNTRQEVEQEAARRNCEVVWQDN